MKQGPPIQRKTIHRIVRGWASSPDDTVDAAKLPPEPNIEPPPSTLPSSSSSDDTNTIRWQVFGTESDGTSSSLFTLESLLLETGWGCRPVTTVENNNNDNHNDITFDCEKRVSYDTERTYHIHIHALEDISSLIDGYFGNRGGTNTHRHILCLPLMTDAEYSKWIPGHQSITKDGLQERNKDFWDALENRIRIGIAYVDIFNSKNELIPSYFRTFDDLFDQPQINSISMKLLIFVDAMYFKKRRTMI